MREVVFDTETTGLELREGHRIVQIGAVELEGAVPTGRTYMTLIDPGREIDPGAAEVHGITMERLAGQPRFEDIIEEFLAFVGDAPLVAHNAEFDRAFLNAELETCGRPPLPRERFVDTVELARKRFPGQKASLDALCKRLGIDNTAREQHDALLDCHLLAAVYLELRGGRQQGLALAPHSATQTEPAFSQGQTVEARDPRPHMPTPEEEAAHCAFLDSLSDPIWRREA